MDGKRVWIFFISVLAITSLTCSAPANIISALGGGSGNIGEITFCSDVTDDGECVDAGTSFPAGSETVYAYFTYDHMKDGREWQRVWLQDGETYYDSGIEEWEDGEEGWVAYSVDDPAGLSGRFTLSILLGGKEVRSASFEIESPMTGEPTENSAGPGGFPAFGPITTAESVTESAFPINVSKTFDYGIKKVAAVFPYSNMTKDLSYTAVWFVDGQEVARDEYPWEDSADGLHSTSLTDDEPLPAGKYRLELYLENEFVRKAEFTIVDHSAPAEAPAAENPPAEQKPTRPATPEEVVVPEALPYFYMIYNANLPILNTIANDNLAGWTTVEVVDENPCSVEGVACYRSSCDKRWGGTVYLTRSRLQTKPDYEVVQDLVHELTHGMEHYNGMKCGCTIEKEFYAYAAELDYLWYSGHQDVMSNQYAIWDANGKVDTAVMWQMIKDGYFGKDCPEY